MVLSIQSKTWSSFLSALLKWRKNSDFFKLAVLLSDSMKRNYEGLNFTGSDDATLFPSHLKKLCYGAFIQFTVCFCTSIGSFRIMKEINITYYALT